MIRVLSENSLPDSEGGLFNAGVVSHPNNSSERHLVVRREKHRGFSLDSGVVLVIDKIEKMRLGEVDNTYELTLEGYPNGSKAEDFRLFWWKGELFAIHTLVVTENSWHDASYLAPVIAKVTRTKLVLHDWCELPVPKQRMEKNWLPFVWNDELYIIYLLDPLRIFKLQGWSWVEWVNEDTGVIKKVGEMFPNGHSMVSLSACELVGDAIIGFWHTRANELYHQGMFKIDLLTRKITSFTPPCLDSTKVEGYKKGCLYVSDLVLHHSNYDSILEIWCGEGDSHTSLIQMTLEYAESLLEQNPFTYCSPLKILLSDRGVGDVVCALYAIQGWMAANIGRGVKLYMNLNHELISALRIPGIQLWRWNGEKVDINLSGNQDDLPMEQRFAYQEKQKGSFKEFYAAKLGVTPKVPVIMDIKPYQASNFGEYIVVFPFSSAHKERDWDEINWIELVTRLLDKGYHIIISDPWIERIEEFPGDEKHTGTINSTLSLIKSASLVVCNESGAGHLGGLIGTPTLVLSGGLNPAIVNDLTKNEFIYKKPLASITVDEVYERVIQMLNKI